MKILDVQEFGRVKNLTSTSNTLLARKYLRLSPASPISRAHNWVQEELLTKDITIQQKIDPAYLLLTRLWWKLLS